MNLEPARAHLARLNRLFDDLSDAADAPSALERDLLREYVRRFYEALSEPAPAHTSASTPAPKPAVENAPEPAPASARAAFEFEPRPQPAAPAPAPPVIEIPAEVEADVQRLERRQDTAPATAATATPPVPVSQVEVIESPFAPEPEELSAAMRALFAYEQGTDLSDRLATRQVSDLGRAFGVNERIEFQNTLFGGYKAEFDQAVQHLNDLPDYDAAVSYLGGGVAEKYDWLDEERQSVAKAFARQVRRRYA